MKKNLVKIVAVVLVGLVSFSIGNKIGNANGYEAGYEDGNVDGIVAGRTDCMDDLEKDARNNINHTGTYYGFDGIEIHFEITEENK